MHAPNSVKTVRKQQPSSPLTRSKRNRTQKQPPSLLTYWKTNKRTHQPYILVLVFLIDLDALDSVKIRQKVATYLPTEKQTDASISYIFWLSLVLPPLECEPKSKLNRTRQPTYLLDNK